MTERAPRAPEREPEPADEPAGLVIRLHQQVVDTPAPRQSFTPAQALHLASNGPSRGPTDRAPDRIVLPEPHEADGPR